jgi:Transposase DDE domain
MVSITHALRRIKEDLAAHLSPLFIEQFCRQVGHAWRDRVLDPVTTIHLFILQILNRNTACSHVPRLAGDEFSASAYCQARSRLPLKVITTLVSKIGGSLQQATAGVGLWKGHRTILVDGSNFSMPDTPPLRNHFGQHGQQKKGCGFPIAHLLAIFDAATGLVLDLIAAPMRTHDMSQVHRLHSRLRPGDLLLGDRGFCSFAHLALALKNGLHACFRMHQIQIVDFRPGRPQAIGKRARGLPRSRWVKALGVQDQVVEWTRPAVRPRWMEPADFAALPETITVRELRYRIEAPGYRPVEITLVTTLLDAQTYTAEDLAGLYKARWAVETNFAHLKTTMGLEKLHCRSLDGVMKELWMFALVYNLVRMVMMEAARRQDVTPDRISFVDALRWLASTPGDAPLPALVINPLRPNRIEPRVVKRRPKSHKLMTKPREILRKELLLRRKTA